MMKSLSGICVVLALAAPTAAQDAISPVTFVGGPDLNRFAVTTTITHVDVHLTGLELRFDKRDGPNRWPDNITPGWSGPLQYSVGLCERLSDQWYCSAPVETWFGNNVIGGPIQSQDPPQITKNWFYDGRWAPLHTHQPAPGEQLGVFVVAGDARNSFTPVRERSNIVLITLPAPNTTVAFDFTAQPLAPPPVPPPVSIDAKPVGIPAPSIDLGAILARFDHLDVELADVNASVHTEAEQTRAQIRSFADQVRSAAAWAVKYVLPAVTGVIAGRQMAK
jgi:hypothetical protein